MLEIQAQTNRVIELEERAFKGFNLKIIGYAVVESLNAIVSDILLMYGT